MLARWQVELQTLRAQTASSSLSETAKKTALDAIDAASWELNSGSDLVTKAAVSLGTDKSAASWAGAALAFMLDGAISMAVRESKKRRLTQMKKLVKFPAA